jgi:type II protein arginine methyltransferase
MVTTPITTDLFHSRVLSVLSSTQTYVARNNSNADHHESEVPLGLVVPPLSAVDTDLSPDESMSQVIAVTSPWIDLCSPDPLVADVSRQVLMLEIAYAAFCGISYVLITGPKLHRQNQQQTGLMQYSRAIQEVLAIGSYMQIKIWLPMIDHPENETAEMGDLGPFARPEYVRDSQEEDSPPLNLFGTWDAWNIIRSFCRYHARLCVGKKNLARMLISTSELLFTRSAQPNQAVWDAKHGLTSFSNSTHSSKTFTSSCHPNKMVFGAHSTPNN